MTAPKYTVGQTVWVTETRLRLGDAKPAVVTKVGSKWATLGGIHTYFSVSTGASAGGYFQIYATHAEWEAQHALTVAWAHLRQSIAGTYNCRPGVTLERIAGARRLLGLEVTP